MGVQGSKYCPACDVYTHWKISRTNCKVCNGSFPAKVDEVKGPRTPTEKELSLTTWEPGYRECVCGHFTAGARSNICVHCGLSLENKEVEKVKRTPTAKELSLTAWEPGYRPCVNCNRFTAGPRSTECVHCENVFPRRGEAAQKLEEEVSPTKVVQVVVFPDIYRYPESDIPTRRIYRATGPCPFKIERADKSTFPTDEAVKAWAHKVRQTLLDTSNQFILNDGLYWWAYQDINGNNVYRYNSEEMEYLKMVIKDLPDVSYKTVA